MFYFEVGDLVEVKKDNDLSPTLRFFFNKKGMIKSLISESCYGRKITKEWEVLFSDGKQASFKEHELKLITKIK